MPLRPVQVILHPHIFPDRVAADLIHYNETRIKKSLGWISSVQYRRHLGLAA